MINGTHARRGTRWTKDSAGATGFGWAVGVAACLICHAFVGSFFFAFTASALVGGVLGVIAFYVMLWVLRRLPY